MNTMSEKAITSKAPGGLLRWLLRFPITLYRLGLGWLLGGRFLLINHVGRKSGQMRQTVVEVAGHDRDSDTYYVASGWGYKSNWYRNLLAQPEISIQVGRRKLPVHAENLSPEAGAQVLLTYRKQHPFTAGELGGFMGLDIGKSSDDELANIVRDSLPIVAFHPR